MALDTMRRLAVLIAFIAALVYTVGCEIEGE